jgi:hypothetical protein
MQNIDLRAALSGKQDRPPFQEGLESAREAIALGIAGDEGKHDHAAARDVDALGHEV